MKIFSHGLKKANEDLKSTSIKQTLHKILEYLKGEEEKEEDKKRKEETHFLHPPVN